LTVTDDAGCSTTFVFTGQTASYNGGPAARTMHTIMIPPATAVTPPPGTSPAISGLRVSPSAFSLEGRLVNGRCAKPTKRNKPNKQCRRVISVRISYTLNLAATVTFTLKRQTPGRNVWGRCVKSTKSNSGHKRCTRSTGLSGKIAQRGKAGANEFIFNGRIGGHTIGAGTYELIATPRGGTPATAIFKIVA
jgi:hypothetical protein